jgi:Na+-translocating ferredoxin:NAD+ oxidoreductase RnfD subunit
MVETVMIFALLSAAFEFALLSKLKPRTRLRLLGSQRLIVATHAFFIISNLVVHYGTVTGSMTAIVAGIAVMPIARVVYGSITRNQYHPGIVKYSRELVV